MKKKIGFIDLFIDEWHANNYPKWVAESSLGGEYEVAYAWEEAAKADRRDLQEWCRQMQITPAASLEEIVQKSDCLCVLAPSNPEVHERLSKLALTSGKPVYVDKPFAPDFATANRIVDWAAKHQTPLMSSSALRFSVELDAVAKLPGPVEFFATTGGGGNFPEYAIHQIEMIVTAMGTGIEAVTVQGKPERLAATLHYSDGRLATLAYSPFLSFTFHAQAKEQTVMNQACSKYFENMIEAMLKFFATRQTPVPLTQTVEIASVLDALVQGMTQPGKRIAVQK
jgi:predicted dehydrogenase